MNNSSITIYIFLLLNISCSKFIFSNIFSSSILSLFLGDCLYFVNKYKPIIKIIIPNIPPTTEPTIRPTLLLFGDADDIETSGIGPDIFVGALVGGTVSVVVSVIVVIVGVSSGAGVVSSGAVVDCWA